MKSNSEHWNRIFRETEDENLGWYESDPAAILRLLEQVDGWKDSTLFLSGAGTSRLTDILCAGGAELVINDISRAALDRVRERVGDQAESIEWVCQDIARPLEIPARSIDIWIDRAVLHFLTDEDDIKGYFRNVLAGVKGGGHALFAEYPPHGTPRCAGLELHRYSLEELSGRLGSDFRLVDSFNHTHINPDGNPRPYMYALFRRDA